MREIVEVSQDHFTCFMLDGNSKLLTSSRSTLVRLLADVIRSGASAIDGEIDVALFGDVPEDGFSHRRATDVTKAHNENFGCHDESCHKLVGE